MCQLQTFLKNGIALVLSKWQISRKFWSTASFTFPCNIVCVVQTHYYCITIYWYFENILVIIDIQQVSLNVFSLAIEKTSVVLINFYWLSLSGWCSYSRFCVWKCRNNFEDTLQDLAYVTGIKKHRTAKYGLLSFLVRKSDVYHIRTVYSSSMYLCGSGGWQIFLFFTNIRNDCLAWFISIFGHNLQQ